MSAPRLVAASVAALTVVLTFVASATAAPRLSSVSTPSAVPGMTVAGTFPTCSAVSPVPLSFTASQAGTAFVTRVQAWPLGLGTLFPGLSTLTFRAGANTIDVRSLAAGVLGTDRPTRMRVAVTLLPVNSRWQFGGAVTRTITVNCS